MKLIDTIETDHLIELDELARANDKSYGLLLKQYKAMCNHARSLEQSLGISYKTQLELRARLK